MRTVEHSTIIADRYALQTRLRSDPGSQTWLANDVVLDRRVRLELLRPELAQDPSVVAALDSATRALARASTGVLLELLDAGVEDGLPFLVTEHVDGRPLDEVLRDDGPLDPRDASAVGGQVLTGLAEAHAAGVVHADVEPSGVIRTADGVRLRTPGTGQALLRARRHGPARAARPLAPEASDGRIDERTDVWFAGSLLFELLTGSAPSGSARFVRTERRDVGRGLEAAIARALAPDPLDRYPDVASMREALDRVAPADGRDVAAADEDDVSARGRARGVFRTWVAVPLLVALVGGLVVAAAVWLGRLELGGPVGLRVPDEASPSASAPPAAIGISQAIAFDPLGDGQENSDNAVYATDGDRTTVWRSENYFDGRLNKDGVGLLLDLGRTSDIGGIRLWTPSPGFSFSVRVGDDPDGLVEQEADETTASEQTRVQLGDARGRYVLLWMTSVVPTADGNRVEVAEVRVLEPSR